MASMINWFEIPVIELERAIQFYETMLEIKIRRQEFGNFRMGLFPAAKSGEVSGALVQLAEHYTPSDKAGALLYLNAGQDLQYALDRVPLAGGKILRPKNQISPENGFMALILDTEGNRIALHSMH